MASIILILKPNEDFKRKEIYKLIFLVNINAKIQVSKPIQQYIKGMIHQNQVGFISGIKPCVTVES